ncbi:response regulator transcription factor [Shewanella gelidii]|uniref:DNA-binding response regulator n=1 Tax=Shewanella gelidii TaxID=1642821 RepID=A0A917JUU9_9GAMM|nr:response regulator transcription factor [Shewanella gelidii]MCL1098036.1 response regulator transcription factor [Shewanella gelidii]GGI85614.1 DNA-binding response regulator [Shewanella gelidii]
MSDNLQLLLVEDDIDLATAIIDYLEIEDIHCDYAANGAVGLNLIQTNQYDVVVLDLNLPKMNGLEVCEKIRAQGIDMPILMLTARDTLEDKLVGFSKGADDYLIKPFAMEELIVRAQVLSRRRSGQIKQLKVADLALDIESKLATRALQQLKLSPTEVKLLECLLRHSPKIVSREKLMRSVWGDEQPDSNSLKVHMFNLRKAVDGNRDADQKLIYTITGRGFVLKPCASITDAT